MFLYTFFIITTLEYIANVIINIIDFYQFSKIIAIILMFNLFIIIFKIVINQINKILIRILNT